MQGVRVGAVGAHFYGRSAKDIAQARQQTEGILAAKFNAENPPLNPNADKIGKLRKRRPNSSLIADKINQQNIQMLNQQPKPKKTKYDPSAEIPQNAERLLDTAEGQEEIGKLIAITKKQKEANKALKSKRKEYEHFLLQYQQESLQKEAKRIEKKKQRMALKTPNQKSQQHPQQQQQQPQQQQQQQQS